jgi:RNA polymerase sigma-70 factor (ECF subfamily)
MIQAVVVSVGIAALMQSPGVEYRATDDAQSLQGLWFQVEMESDGKKLNKDALKGAAQMLVKGSEMWIGKDAARQMGRYKTYKLDTTKTPKQIDLTSHDGQEKGQTAAAIYKLEDDRLTICMPYFTADPSTRPTQFTTVAGDTLMITVFERAPAN